MLLWQGSALADWWYFRNYTPSPQIAAIAAEAQLNENGKRLFYRANPEIDSKQVFNEHCPVFEESFVLGCYTGRRIYVLQVDRAELDGVMEVTAAHEMLHAAYDRLDAATREKVNSDLEAHFKTVTDAKVRQLVGTYTKADPASRLNEMHSILPTQLESLSPELENYYSRYFTNRKAVALSYKRYESVFENLENQIAALEVEIQALQSDLTTLEDEILRQQAEIERTNQQLATYDRNNNVDAYNALVPRQNQLVREYNANVQEYKDIIELHNSKVEQLNQLGVAQSELVNSLDSKKFEKL